MAVVAWNPADKAAAITLSNGNLTAAHDVSAVSQAIVRADTGQSAGDWSFDVYVDLLVNNIGVGIANLSHTLTNYLGSSVNGFGYFNDGYYEEQSILGGTFLGTTFTTGDTVTVQARKTANEIKLYKNGSIITTITGLAITGDWYPAIDVKQSTDQITANFGALPMTLPAGSKSWDGSQPFFPSAWPDPTLFIPPKIKFGLFPPGLGARG